MVKSVKWQFYVFSADAPYQENITKCFWSFNQTQLCRIMFFTGTNVEVIEVRKNGKIIVPVKHIHLKNAKIRPNEVEHNFFKLKPLVFTWKDYCNFWYWYFSLLLWIILFIGLKNKAKNKKLFLTFCKFSFTFINDFNYFKFFSLYCVLLLIESFKTYLFNIL